MDLQTTHQDTYTIVIDPRRELTANQYASLKGMTAGRVSQLKKEGQLRTRYIPELNLELIILDPNDQELNRPFTRMPQPAQHYSFRQAGNVFSSILVEYETAVTQYERTSWEQKERIEKLLEENEKLRLELEEIRPAYAQLGEVNTTLEREKAALGQQCEQLEGEAAEYRHQVESLQQSVSQQRQELAGVVEDNEKQALQLLDLTQQHQQLADQYQELEKQRIALEKQLTVEQTKNEAKQDLRQEILNVLSSMSSHELPQRGELNQPGETQKALSTRKGKESNNSSTS